MMDIPTDLQPPEYIFREIALPNYLEFREDELSRRKAYNTAISITHMADHIVKSRGGTKGEVGDLLKEFRKRSRPFADVEMMCNAIKHTIQIGPGNKPVAYATGMAPLQTTDVWYFATIEGVERRVRPDRPILVFPIGGTSEPRKAPVAWTLFIALRFIAQEIRCEHLVPDVYAPALANVVWESKAKVLGLPPDQ